ncbi:MAG: patatin-like phospholipase family protein [Desulfobacterales bacterium]|nr:patatin-like phospholipase family protein [Desulfobacterales bacterium]
MRYPGVVILLLLVALLTGCAGFGTVSNQQASETTGVPYSFINPPKTKSMHHGEDNITLVLAFSGGGTRAAALSYGVLEALRDYTVISGGREVRLIDEVDLISSVSGGSFTAAYYGLHGDGIFTDFEPRFLRRDVSGALMDRLLSPSTWFSSKARSEMAVEFYEKNVFGDATFNDLKAAGGPLIIINASDLGGGVRFSFLQEYFGLLCSDLGNFPVARAVAASSAVPILFSPVVLENFPGCSTPANTYLQTRETDDLPAQVSQVVAGLKTYADKDSRRYIHLVDGGITDNLGLMAIYEMVEVAGGAGSLSRRADMRPGRQFVLITVNAATHARHNIESTNEDPSLEDTVNTMTDIQLHRYNAATLDLMKRSVTRWTEELSASGNKVTPYFIELGFHTLDTQSQDYFNTVPTNFSLTNHQVDRLIAQGRDLLMQAPEFRRFLQDNPRLQNR